MVINVMWLLIVRRSMYQINPLNNQRITTTYTAYCFVYTVSIRLIHILRFHTRTHVCTYDIHDCTFRHDTHTHTHTRSPPKLWHWLLRLSYSASAVGPTSPAAAAVAATEDERRPKTFSSAIQFVALPHATHTRVRVFFWRRRPGGEL